MTRQSLDFWRADIVGRELGLALQVGDIDPVIVVKDDMTHARRRQYLSRHTAKRARTNDQNPGIQQILLAGPTDFLHEEMAFVSFDLIWSHRNTIGRFAFFWGQTVSRASRR